LKSRVLLLFCGLMILWAALVLRAGWLQIIPDERMAVLQERQFQTVITLQNRRGAIVDRNGRDLALSMTAFSLYADPKILLGKKNLSKRLGKSLGMSAESIAAKLKDNQKRFVWLARLLPREKYDEIKSWDIRGLSFVEEFKRVYPNENLLASTLGFVGGEGQGLEGLELAYDKVLRGDKKKVIARRDARGRPLVGQGMMFAENIEGSEIRLTVDAEVQHVLENEIEKAVNEFGAEQAFGVILHAKTSAIVAMANTPTFDANRAIKVANELRRNRVVTDTFEPGSVLKTIAIAAALREKKIAPNTRIDTENGKFIVGDRIIREAETTHRWKNLTVSEVLAYSSNIGTTKVAFMLGAESLRNALMDFGFGSKNGIDLPGEARGALLPLPWRPHLLSNISFGQGITATPLQVANAYAVIANGGVLNEPYLVASLRDPETGKIEHHEAKKPKRVLTAEDAAAMRMMLAGATSAGGTGMNAKVDGFVVAGKTGTAQKVDPHGRGYLKGAYISSFAGFIPANDPEYVIFVAVDHPKKNSYYGSQVAAPVFSRVASYIVRRDGLAPLSLSEKNLIPRVKRELAGERDVTGPAFSQTAKTAADILGLQRAPMMDVIPDLSGLTARQVLQKFSGQPVHVQIRGQGLVADVIPSPGTPMVDLKRITVILR
jgi:cell division protein FtsI (penicillin-binding protein 3)